MAKTLIDEWLFGVAAGGTSMAVSDGSLWAYDNSTIEASGSSIVYVVGNPTVYLSDDAAVVVIHGDPKIIQSDKRRNTVYVHEQHEYVNYHLMRDHKIIPGINWQDDEGWYWRRDADTTKKHIGSAYAKGNGGVDTNGDIQGSTGRRTRTDCATGSHRKSTSRKRAA